jgi:phytoene desaturase
MGAGRSVCVIGAGLGGLSAAIHLSLRGFDVSVYEQNEIVGGKAGEVVIDGFRFDTGPSLLTMPFVAEELFRSAGADLSKVLTLQRIDPLCRYFFPDGSVFDAHADERSMIYAISHFAPGDVDGYRRFLRYSKAIYDLTSEIFIFNSLLDVRSLLRWSSFKTLAQIPRIDAFRTVHESVSSFFGDPRLVQLFDRYATYNGSNPYQAPATLNVIPYVEYGLGGYYIRGGMHRLCEALKDLAVSLGVSFHFRSAVKEIAVDRGRVKGLVLSDNSQALCDAVVSNADAVYTLSHLLKGGLKRKPESYEPSSSGLVFLWGVDAVHHHLQHHNIFFSSEYRKEFDELFVLKSAPSDPTVYVSITSKTDPDHAPEGKENWFVLVNMPSLSEASASDDVDLMRERVLRKLRDSGVSLEGKILFERTISPRVFEKRFNAFRGSIYGISSNSRGAAFLRPPNQVRNPKGLFLCGGAAHPGGGMPLVLISGRLAAEACSSYLQ